MSFINFVSKCFEYLWKFISFLIHWIDVIMDKVNAYYHRTPLLVGFQALISAGGAVIYGWKSTLVQDHLWKEPWYIFLGIAVLAGVSILAPAAYLTFNYDKDQEAPPVPQNHGVVIIGVHWLLSQLVDHIEEAVVGLSNLADVYATISVSLLLAYYVVLTKLDRRCEVVGVSENLLLITMAYFDSQVKELTRFWKIIKTIVYWSIIHYRAHRVSRREDDPLLEPLN
ncbi:unnamed protein product [Eruca vesicaria subsp. sativa]|uniref:Uncharacterized protein n=1 Tax=Eruca vesicaria subsp. sativa TaxID=29727 RepID=A0ABC8L553_ERUVS|nr:unnamed protein product [Eruca vesicaria subsp. sativa]